MQERVQLKMSKKENNFSNKLESSGLSRNHEKLSKNSQFIEKLTKFQRAQPYISSEVLNNSFKYREQQLERKTQRHLFDDYNISIERKTKTQQGLLYFYEVEKMLKTADLVVREDEMMNHQEPAIIFFAPKLKLFASFENNVLYEDHYFISSYEIDGNAVKKFIRTGNIGESRETRKAKIDQNQKLKSVKERMQKNKNSFYQILPKNLIISNCMKLKLLNRS